MLVEALNDVLQNLDATGSVDSSVVHAGGAQTLAILFYDRNGHGRGEVLLTLDIQPRLHDTLRNYARTLEIANIDSAPYSPSWLRCQRRHT